jgi:hypothetical protein
MLLVEALVILHRAKRLQHPLISGMLVTLPLSGDTDPVRYGGNWHGTALGTAMEDWADDWGEERAGHPDAQERHLLDPASWPQPVLSDPGTEGCLKRLLQQAFGFISLGTTEGLGVYTVSTDTGGGLSSCRYYTSCVSLAEIYASLLIEEAVALVSQKS